MASLLATLTPIALLDGLSILPFAALALAVLLTGSRPLLGSASFLAAIFLCYLGCGLLLLLGLGAIFAEVDAWLRRWYAQPNPAELVVQLLLGLAMLGFGARIAAARSRRQKPAAPDLSPAGAFGLGAVATIAGMPGAFPYFAAVDRILRADAPPATGALAIAYYNAVFVAMPAALVAAHRMLGSRGDALLRRLSSWLEHWGRRVGIAVLLVLGALLTLDAIGFLFGHPLLPTGTLPVETA